MIDAHQHFWRLDRGDYGWLDGAGPLLRRDYLPGDLAPLLHRYGVSHTIAVQAAPSIAETEYLLDLADSHDFIAGVVGWLDFESADFSEQLARLVGRPKLVGLRPMLQDIDDDRWILRPRVLAALEQVRSAGLALDVLSKPRHLPFVIEALQSVPGLRAVVDHISKPPIESGEAGAWESDMIKLAANPNVYCKISGLITEASHTSWSVGDLTAYVGHVVTCFGAERVMWGSDWPVCRLAGEYGDVLAAATLSLPPALSRDAGIFGENAARFYGLTLG